MRDQEIIGLQEAYMQVVMNELDEGRGDDLRQKYGLNPGEASARLSNRAERIALNIGGLTHFERQKRNPLLRLSGLSRSRSQGKTPTDPRINSQGQLRDIRSRGGRPPNVYDGGANRDRGDKGNRFAKFVSGERNNPNMTNSERRTAHHNREEYDLYDIILSHLLDEGYAETLESAEAIMVNMSEDWVFDVLNEVKGFGGHIDPNTGKPSGLRSPSQQAHTTYWRNRQQGTNVPDPRRSKFKYGGSKGSTTGAHQGEPPEDFAKKQNPDLATTPTNRMRVRATALAAKGKTKQANKIRAVMNRPPMG